MATSLRQFPPNNPTSVSSPKSILKAYFVPILLLFASLFFQLIVLPRNFPPSHYDVLGVPKYSSIEEVTQAYENITSRWNSSVEVPPTVDLIKVQYAFELLSNKLWKRDYDVYNIDEHLQVLENAKERYSGKHISEIDLPLIVAPSSDPRDQEFSFITSQNFLSVFEDDKALLLQISSLGSNRCTQFSGTWQRIVTLLNGVANTGVVELGDVKLGVYLAERKYTGQPFFKSGVPSLLVLPPGCRDSSCLSRYVGELSVDAITDWLVTRILRLPRIPYYSKESLVHDFLVKSKPHQVKVIFISKTGERATPFIRQAAKIYSPYATFAFTLWNEADSAFWWQAFGVESTPAIVFMKDPGVEPAVYLGAVNSSHFVDIMEKNKHYVLPQLRNITATELGCDVHGNSRAGSDIKVWYCAIVAGRPSQELRQMRETLRRVQNKLLNDGDVDIDDQDHVSATAVSALKQKRLSFAWLDGEAQHKYCSFHIHSEDSFETCGSRRGMTDVARLFIIRYQRNPTDEKEKPDTKKKANNIFHDWYQPEADPVFTLVAKYNGSSEMSEMIRWISQTIKDGDAKEIPPFKTKAPELVPEDSDNWSQGSKKLVSSGKTLKQWIDGFISSLSDKLGDPRIGPALLLAALMYSGLIWLNRSRSTQPNNRNESNQQKDEDKPRRRRQPRSGSNQLIPPSITDMEPRDAQQLSSASDSE